MSFVWKIILITALAGMGGTGLGGVVSCLFRRDSSRTVSLLLSFAAGVRLLPGELRPPFSLVLTRENAPRTVDFGEAPPVAE